MFGTSRNHFRSYFMLTVFPGHSDGVAVGGASVFYEVAGNERHHLGLSLGIISACEMANNLAQAMGLVVTCGCLVRRNVDIHLSRFLVCYVFSMTYLPF